MDSIILASFNTKGIKDIDKRLTTFTWCKEKNIDICLLQETHLQGSTERLWCQNWGGPIRYSHGSSGARGVAILLSKNLDHKIIDSKSDKDGRIIIIQICIRDITYTIANIYAPNDDNPNFFMELQELLGKFDNNNIIIGGISTWY